MPDKTQDCGIILAQLEELRRRMGALEDKHIEHCSQNRVALKDFADKIERVEEKLGEKLDEIIIQRAEERGQFTGATWALARVGAVALAVLGVIGWLITGGGLSLLKKLSQ